MKEVKIEVPNGYEIDRENSTFEKIVFKEIKKALALPKTWEEFKESEQPGYVFAALYTTLKSQKAYTALAKLERLCEVYRNGWEPNWDDENFKFCIKAYNNGFDIILVTHACYFLSFQTKEIAEDFLFHFRDLIEQAKPLMS